MPATIEQRRRASNPRPQHPRHDPALILLHGFPSSSYDFRELMPLLGDHALLTFDFLGFGLSDKPAGHDYSLFGQADLVEELVRRHLPERSVFLVAHDMGTSVATELMARDLDGSGSDRHLAERCSSTAASCSTRPR